MGVAKGQAVMTERGLIGHVVNAGTQSARVLLLTDVSSRIPVRLERANVKAILAGDGTASPYLDYLPRGALLVAGDRVVTASDGGVFPPGLPVGIVGEGGGIPRVTPFTDERRADFVRIIRYEAPLDADIGGGTPEPLPGARRPEPPRPPVEPGPPVVAGAPGPATPSVLPANAVTPQPPVQTGTGAAAPASEQRR